MATFRAALLFVAAPLALSPCCPVWGETPSEAQTSAAPSYLTATSAPRTGAQLRAAVRSAFKNAAAAKGPDQEDAARTLVALYRELGEDTSLTATQRASLSATARDRLTRISKPIQNRLAREKNRAGHGKRVAAARRPRRDDELLNEVQQLEVQQFPVAAQQFAFPAQQFPAAGAGAAHQRQPFQPPLFGPPTAWPMTQDRGQELVELIEQTIAPDTWAVHGGQGTIYYFRPWHALIVNQSAEAHDQLGALIKQLGK